MVLHVKITCNLTVHIPQDDWHHLVKCWNQILDATTSPHRSTLRHSYKKVAIKFRFGLQHFSSRYNNSPSSQTHKFAKSVDFIGYILYYRPAGFSPLINNYKMYVSTVTSVGTGGTIPGPSSPGQCPRSWWLARLQTSWGGLSPAPSPQPYLHLRHRMTCHLQEHPIKHPHMVYTSTVYCIDSHILTEKNRSWLVFTNKTQNVRQMSFQYYIVVNNLYTMWTVVFI